MRGKDSYDKLLGPTYNLHLMIVRGQAYKRDNIKCRLYLLIMLFVVFLKRVSSYLIKDEILILIHMIQEDLEVQIHVKEVFDRIKSKGIEVLNKFFELLVDRDYQTLYEYFK